MQKTEEASVRSDWRINHSNIAHECQHSSISPLTLKTRSQSNGMNERGAIKTRSASQAAGAGHTTWQTEEQKAVTTMKPGSNPPCVLLLAAALCAPLHVCSRLYRADSPASSASHAPWTRSHACMTESLLSSLRSDIQRCASVRERREHSLRILLPLSPVVPWALCKPPLRRPTLSWQRGQIDGWTGERWCQWRHSAHATIGRESRMQSLHCSWGSEGERTQRQEKRSLKLELKFLILRSCVCRAVSPHPSREDRCPQTRGAQQLDASIHINTWTPHYRVPNWNKHNRSFRFLCVCVWSRKGAYVSVDDPTHDE